MKLYRRDLVIYLVLYLTDFVYLANTFAIAIIINFILDMIKENH